MLAFVSHALKICDSVIHISPILPSEPIPFVAILTVDGSVISKDGRSATAVDPIGEEFQMFPKVIFNLKDHPGSIQEVPTALFCEKWNSEDSGESKVPWCLLQRIPN